MSDKKPALLLCLDLEEGSEDLARYVAGMTRSRGQPLHLLHVEPTGGSPVIKNCKARLKNLAVGPLAGVKVEAIVIRRGLAEDEIIAYAKEHDVDPIVIGRRRRRAIERIYVGSTTSAVLSLTSCPVLVVPLSGKKVHR